MTHPLCARMARPDQTTPPAHSALAPASSCAVDLDSCTVCAAQCVRRASPPMLCCIVSVAKVEKPPVRGAHALSRVAL